MPELVFFTGSMGSGKSTLALQTVYNQQGRGRTGLVFTCLDRSSQALLTSRTGMSSPAIHVDAELDFFALASAALRDGEALDYLVCDEAQFYTAAQVDQLADVVDILNVDVFAFGLVTDFRTVLFPGSQRLLELADRIVAPASPALCWCGRPGTHQARLVDGIMVEEGAVIVVGDTGASGGQTTYEVLCRRHHRLKQPLPLA